MQTGNSRSVLVVLAILLLGLGIGSTELRSQFGGLVKKAKSVVSPPESGKSTEASTQSGNSPAPSFNDRVLELNTDNLAKLEKALTCEKDFRAQVNAKFAKMQTPEQYQQCMIQVMMSPEAQAIAESKSADVTQQGMQLMALQEKKCGKDPQRINKGEELRPAKEQGAKCGGLTLTQYNIAVERIAPFCNAGGQEKVKGSGSNIYYVYTPAEVSAVKPNCSKLMALINENNEPARR
jgi:hypothetical protein